MPTTQGTQVLLPDVNVLLYALRSDTTDHDAAQSWLDDAHAADEPVALCPPTLAGLLRVATNPRVFVTPTPRAVLWDFVEALRSSPLHRWVAAGPRHPDLLQQLCREADATGNLVSDAVIGAIAVEHGCRVVSTDGDFARFASVRWSRPWPLTS